MSILIQVPRISKPTGPLCRVDVGLTLRFDLLASPPPRTTSPHLPYSVRELNREEVEPLLGHSPSLRRPVHEIDSVAPHGWRCFVAFHQERPVHASFVELRPHRPLLFGVVTDPASRRTGAFLTTFIYLATQMRQSDAKMIFSSASMMNRVSVAAHRAVGFTVVKRTFDVFVYGVSLRRAVRRVVRVAARGGK